VKQKNLPFNQRYIIFKSRVKKVYADFHGKDPQIDPLLKNLLRYFSPRNRGGAGNRKHVYYPSAKLLFLNNSQKPLLEGSFVIGNSLFG
jgi:hypothetical protein